VARTATGADRVVDYTKNDFTKDATTYDLILDVVVGSSFSRCQQSLKPHGVFLQSIMGLTTLLGSCGRPLPAARNSRAAWLWNIRRGYFIAGPVAAGKLKAVIERSYPLERTAEAFKCVEQGHKKGNVIITGASMNATILGTIAVVCARSTSMPKRDASS
jgi:NADPH:quinone reductase-like Zn-dependent oxidoreductase